MIDQARPEEAEVTRDARIDHTEPLAKVCVKVGIAAISRGRLMVDICIGCFKVCIRRALIEITYGNNEATSYAF